MPDEPEWSFPWYARASGPELEQGDILLGCPIFELPREAADPEARVHTIVMDTCNVIVMTQSCDLVPRESGQAAAYDVILCPLYTKSELTGSKVFGSNRSWNEAKRGRFAGYHVLNRCNLPGLELDFTIVDFRRIYTLSVPFLRRFAASVGPRARLFPPYREHLAQAFARFFMRVGLPVDIPDFKETRG